MEAGGVPDECLSRTGPAFGETIGRGVARNSTISVTSH
jgi:hypothetical protein